MRRATLKLCAAIALAATAVTAAAADYPTKPIRLVVPFGPGSGADVPSRRVAMEMSKLLGQQIVVDNRQGAGGIVGSEIVAKSAPDGYTLLAGTMSTHGLNPGLYKRLPYDPIKSYMPISRIAAFPNVLVVPSSLGVTNMKQLLELANKSNPPLTFSSSGVGTTLHLAGEMFQRAAGVKLLHVPYADMAQYMPDLVAGRTDMTFGNLPQVLPFIKSGKLVPIAITTPQRSPLIPSVPTMAEVGFKDAEMAIWIAFFAPAGTPPEVAEKLNGAVNTALGMNSIKDAFAPDGISVTSDRSPTEFASFLRDDVKRWVKVIEDAGVPKQ